MEGVLIYFLLVTNISHICLIIDFYLPFTASLSRDSNYAAFEDWSPNCPEEHKDLMFDYYRDTYIECIPPYFHGSIPSVRPEDCLNCSPKFGKHGDPEAIYEEIMRCTPFLFIQCRGCT